MPIMSGTKHPKSQYVVKYLMDWLLRKASSRYMTVMRKGKMWREGEHPLTGKA